MNKRFLIIFICLILLLTGCYIPSDPSEPPVTPDTPVTSVTPEPPVTSDPSDVPNPSGEPQNQQNVTDSPVVTEAKPTIAVPTYAPKSEPIYNSERSAGEMPDVDLKVLYLTVKEGDTDETNHTWKEINTYSGQDYANMGVDRYKISGILYEGTEKGITDNEGMECTVSYRGQASSKAKQKSYKIKLTDETWMDQKVLNLNKHFPDHLRFLNKFAYDIIDEVPQMIGLKTQFVRLYVKDLSGGADPDTAAYVDYGLFTHVEQLNGRALKRLNLDKNCCLYKVNAFEFWEYDDVKPTTDPTYDETAFNNRLENKGNTDNEKLIKLMDLVNDKQISDQTILDYYVEKENIAYWMAFQILIDNVDTNCRNFYLYSPSDSEKWYIISWDNDGAFSRLKTEKSNTESAPWRYGVHNYWGTVLFNRLLHTKDFRDALVKAATDLKENYLTKEHVSNLLNLYEKTVGYVFNGSGDKADFPKERHDKMLSGIPDNIEENYDRLIDSLNHPTPFSIGGPSYNPDTNEVFVRWHSSYDFNDRGISYVIEVTDDPYFEKILYTTETENINITFSHEWGPGQFFVRVTAKNSDGYTMGAFTKQRLDGFGTVFGASMYTIE
ncbi:MAG: CotH kinase family protein [Lachnospiraceae bacterium]|nr:CotH kinase family protein [Lachnospiraceae bacterium]